MMATPSVSSSSNGNGSGSGSGNANANANGDGDLTAADIVIPVVPRPYAERKKWIVVERIQSVQRYAIASKKSGGIPDPDHPKNKESLERTERLLNFLENDFDISPAYKQDARVDEILKLIFQRPEFTFPDRLRQRAGDLYQEWEDANWGEQADEDEDENENVSSPTSTTATAPQPATQPSQDQITAIRKPPPDHPIWGIGGIMHGVAPKVGSKTQVLDRRYPKRSAKVRGHNGFSPGDWWPGQLAALASGAHGERIAGISGDTSYGAYSIVVAGHYKDVDDDRGDIIYYSGPGSQTSQDRHRLPATKGTGILQTSVNTQNPTRVLRAAVRHSAFAPTCGIRYDGLYRVVKQEALRVNSRGGLYTRYVLERLPDQESLRSITGRSPSVKQMRDYERIWDLW